MLTVGDLFSGIGGFSLGLERAGMRTAWFAEVDPYASAVLRKHWPDVPNHGDVRSIRVGTVERVDVICGGFRIIQELKPTWVCCENVTHFDGVALEDCIAGLEASGYEVAPPLEIPACAVDADHIRARLWILGYANGNGEPGMPVDAKVAWHQAVSTDAECGRHTLGRDAAGARRERQSIPRHGMGEPKDSAGGVGIDDGLSHRMDRLRCLGNSIHPDIAEIIGRAIVSAHA